MAKQKTPRTDEERRAIVESIDLRVASGGMSHREATRLEGVSDALVHSWRRNLQGPTDPSGRRTATPKPPKPVAATPLAPATKLRVPEAHLDAAMALVQALRAGDRPVLRYDGTAWTLSTN